MDNLIEFGIKTNIECLIRENVNDEIEKKVQAFRKELEDRKDKYIAEVMKGIRIIHEREHGSMSTNYKVIFENIYRVEDKQHDN